MPGPKNSLEKQLATRSNTCPIWQSGNCHSRPPNVFWFSRVAVCDLYLHDFLDHFSKSRNLQADASTASRPPTHYYYGILSALTRKTYPTNPRSISDSLTSPPRLNAVKRMPEASGIGLLESHGHHTFDVVGRKEG